MNEPTTHPTPSTQALQKAVLAMPMARTLGLRFVRAEPGATELEMPIADALCFTPGQLQATAIFALGDFAAVWPQVHCCLQAGPMPRWTAA
jgi:acyl-coenzyme A thioesterase PaaI-like protein